MSIVRSGDKTVAFVVMPRITAGGNNLASIRTPPCQRIGMRATDRLFCHG
jgi:hypothetical protein